jgi:hypothetical protein
MLTRQTAKRPDIWEYDSRGGRAVSEARVNLLFDSSNKDVEIAAKSNDLIGAAHLSFPGIGHIRTGSPAR